MGSDRKHKITRPGKDSFKFERKGAPARPKFGVRPNHNGPRSAYVQREKAPRQNSREDFREQRSEQRDPKDTSWQPVANWYKNLASEDKSYQQELIYPKSLELVQKHFKQGSSIIDIACGSGEFTTLLDKTGFKSTGADKSATLVKYAQQYHSNIKFFVADMLSMPVPEELYDGATSIMALQNVKELSKAITNAARQLKDQGTFIFVILHPCFRIPRQSGWGTDEQRKLQFRRVDMYKSELAIPIKLHPHFEHKSSHSNEKESVTWTYHHPLEKYFSVLAANKFAVTGLEEWYSAKNSAPGKNAAAENRARSEFPMFMAVSCKLTK